MEQAEPTFLRDLMERRAVTLGSAAVGGGAGLFGGVLVVANLEGLDASNAAAHELTDLQDSNNVYQQMATEARHEGYTGALPYFKHLEDKNEVQIASAQARANNGPSFVEGSVTVGGIMLGLAAGAAVLATQIRRATRRGDQRAKHYASAEGKA